MSVPLKSLDELKTYAEQNQLLDGNLASVETEMENAKNLHPASRYSVTVVSIVAYLIGVPAEHFGKEYQQSVYDHLETDSGAKTIRSLCIIRNALLRNPGAITSALRISISNLDSIPDFIDPALFQYLNSQNIRLIQGAKLKTVTEYIISVNQQISNNVNNCTGRLFPAWVKHEFIKDMIVMPKGSKSQNVQAEIDCLRASYNKYPYQCYINWPVGRNEALVEDPENYLDPVTNSNIILNDRKFLVLLYRIHGSEFTDFGRVDDADQETKSGLIDYVENHERIVMLIDCENSDPYKLCAVFDCLNEAKARSGSANSIEKVILFDDVHTVDAWDILNNYVKNAPVEHQEVGRVLGHKSLVDIALTAGACKEYYMNHVRNYVIVSSDSDFWGLMGALPDSEFLVLAERSKLSNEAESFYREHGLSVCLMDDFAGSLSHIKEDALSYSLERHINNLFEMNLKEMFEDAYATLRLDMSSKEKENYVNRLTNRISLNIAGDGEMSIKVDRR